jgi:glycosyltransferase involved in cell wall biosynthesis
MKFLIVSHVLHKKNGNQYFAYAPYVNEMNIWIKNVDELHILAPICDENYTKIDVAYKHDNIVFHNIPSFDLTTLKNAVKSIFKIPYIIYILFKAFSKVDHIHLRCPGNIGLLGCVVQLFFPKKKKTAKYAGNWDPKSIQPLSYNIQKQILNNTFLTKNIQVLVYGKWEKTSKNIKPFFTATYLENEKETLQPRSLSEKINFVFVGTLSEGKRALYSIQLVEKSHKLGFNVQLDLFGDGVLKEDLNNYIIDNQLTNFVFLNGNQNKEIIKEAYKQSNFLILPSKSEGWPKAVAEAMFWACLPLTTNVSCVKDIIDNQKRGKFLSLHLNEDVQLIKNLIENETVYRQLCLEARNWSQNYTIEKFEKEIKYLLCE